MRSRWRIEPRQALLLVVLLLVAAGTVMVYSSSALSTGLNPRIQDEFLYLRRQVTWIALAGVAMALIARFDYRGLLRFERPLFWVTVVLLALTRVPFIGTAYNGAYRWLRFAGLGFQPSDLAKITLVVSCAAFIVRRQEELADFRRGFLAAIGPLLLLVALVAIEPDLGTSIFLLALGVAMLVIGGVPARHVLLPLAAGLPVFLALMWARFSHIEARLRTWLDPSADLHGKGHQIHQSLVALGSGGWTGFGLGHAPAKRYYLPEESTDFIFAVIGQEFGFLGSVVVVALFMLLVWTGIWAARRAEDLFGSLLATGITLALGTQAAMNIAVVTATVPTKGIGLPLISFGGSSVFFSLVGIGLLLAVARRGREEMVEHRLDEVLEAANPFVAPAESARPQEKSAAFVESASPDSARSARGLFSRISKRLHRVIRAEAPAPVPFCPPPRSQRRGWGRRCAAKIAEGFGAFLRAVRRCWSTHTASTPTSGSFLRTPLGEPTPATDSGRLAP